MDKACRLCLDSEENMTSIFDEDQVTSDLQLKIKDFCTIEIFDTDILPKIICSNCTKKISSIEEFRTRCKHSDVRLREHYNIFNVPKSGDGCPLSKVAQDICVQPKNESKDDSASSKHSVISMSVNKPEIDSALRQESTEDEKNEISNFVTNSIWSMDNYENESEPVKKNGTIGEKKSRIKSSNEKRPKKSVKKKEKLACNLCNKIYVSKKSLLKHTEAHTNEEIIMCKVCNKTFNNADKLSQHIKKHDQNIDLKCEVCGMPFKEQVKLNFHLRVHGKGPPINTEKQYLCDMCSRTFASKSGLRFHLKSHAGTKPYECRYCNKSFTIPSYKKRHERTHTGDKHFICHICNAGFASANGLKYHLRSHTGEANYHCLTCGKSFRRKKYLKEHTFIHTGERPFICRICGSTYGNSGSLYVHEKKCKTRCSIEFIDIDNIKKM